MRNHFILWGLLFVVVQSASAQIAVDLRGFKPGQGSRATVHDKQLVIDWPADHQRSGRLVLNLERDSALIYGVSVVKGGVVRVALGNADPAFLLRVGKRDLVSQNGWNIFFDKVPLKPYHTYRVMVEKKGVVVVSY